jgi:nitrite reductase/ring-hydroxylating ferredoxin subunit
MSLARRIARLVEDMPRDRVAVTRRRLLMGGGAAAVAAIAGVVAGVVGDRLAGGDSGDRGPRELVPADATWQPVMAAAAVPAGRAVRFSTGAVEGFVINRGGRYQAVSAVCTHLGCVLREAGVGRLTCPCHRAVFGLDGSVLSHELPIAPGSLPLLRTRVHDGQVEVLTA